MQRQQTYISLDLNDHDFGPRRFNTVIPLSNAPDRLAQDYPGLSPYLYCAADPINLIDPTGDDVFEVNSKGEIVKHIKTTDEDAFQLVDDKGKPIDGKRNIISLIISLI